MRKKPEAKTFYAEACYNKNKFKNSDNALMRVFRETSYTENGATLYSHSVTFFDPSIGIKKNSKKQPTLILQEDGNGYRATYSDYDGTIRSFYVDYFIAEQLLLVLKLDYEVDRGNELRFCKPPRKSRKTGK